MEYLFGILNLGHWDLFEIWLLVLGIFFFNQAGRFGGQRLGLTTNYGQSS
jgi:hypothetical protein